MRFSKNDRVQDRSVDTPKLGTITGKTQDEDIDDYVAGGAVYEVRYDEPPPEPFPQTMWVHEDFLFEEDAPPQHEIMYPDDDDLPPEIKALRE